MNSHPDGPCLETVGALYGCPRRDGEPDAAYGKRIAGLITGAREAAREVGYQPDVAVEEAWQASPESKRIAARLLRDRAAWDLAKAERLEREAGL